MFHCTECDKAYTKQTSLSRHLQNHLQSKQHTCPICHVSFHRRDLLSRHSKIHKSGVSSPGMRQSHGRRPDSQGRQRCHTACTPCRESRTKCDGSQPCLSCVGSGKTCGYSRTMNRLSRAPIPKGSGFLESTSHETAQDEVSFENDNDVERPESHQSQMDLDEPEVHGFLLSPTASSKAPFFGNNRDMQQNQPDLFTQSFQNAECSLSGPDMSIGMLGPLLSDLASDTMGWPWLHENLFLQPEYSEVWTSMDEQGLMNDDLLRNMDEEIHNSEATVVTSESPLALGKDTTQPGQGTMPAQAPPVSSSNSSKTTRENDEQRFCEYEAAEQRRIIDEIVTQATEIGSSPASKTARTAHWSFMSMKIRKAFALSNEHSQHSPHILQVFVELYFQHFGPLWPLLSRQNLDCDLLHPLLFLTLTSIGAMYGGAESAHYGTLMHARLRQSLTTGLDFGEIDQDLVWLGQARLLTQVTALYFGQNQAFSYAQHLGGILVAQARRMNLFKAPRFQSDESSESRRPVSERLTRWLYLEARRRLAFGILRAETYTSVLLSTRPLVSPEEVDLELPYADSTWRSAQLPPEIFLAMVERDRASRIKQRFSDVLRTSFERDESPSALDPMGHELLLFGMQQSVWRFSHDHDLFLQLMENMTESSQSRYDGLDAMSSSPPISNRSTCPMEAGRPVEPPLPRIQEDHLRGSPKRMNDLQTDLDRLVAALQKWKESLNFIRNSISLQQDRNSVLSSLLLYHLSYIRLQAPIEDMHYVSYRITDKRPLEKQIVKSMYEWANSRRAVVTVQHACRIWSLINKEVRRPEGTRAQFNFLAFTGLHHTAVALWTFMGAHHGLESQESWFIEPIVDSDSRITVDRSHSREILVLLSQAFNLIGPGRWSSFATVALNLSDCQFPQFG